MLDQFLPNMTAQCTLTADSTIEEFEKVLEYAFKYRSLSLLIEGPKI
jgi:hypothetical protein